MRIVIFHPLSILNYRAFINYPRHFMSDYPAIIGGAPHFHSPVQFVRPDLPQLDEIASATQDMLKSGMVTKGPIVQKFERAVAQYLGVKHAIAVSSCTTGLMLTYRALGLSGEVIVPSFTFMATASALIWAGCHPVFADIDYNTGNLDPDCVEKLITPETTAIVAVHVFGNPAPMQALQEIADRHNLSLIYDAAHGFGAKHAGKPVGSQGDVQVFSMSPHQTASYRRGRYRRYQQRYSSRADPDWT